MPYSSQDHPGHDVIVVGASAGGVEALSALMSGLPADLPAAVFVVLHLPEDAFTVLPRILTRAGKLSAYHPGDRDPIQAGRVYVAPPGRHMLLERGVVRIVDGPHENRHRPAIDPLFRTAARAYGSRVIGVILTGSGDDGASGLLDVKRAGGVAVVQDPREAMVPSMPRAALECVEVDHCLSLEAIPVCLAKLAMVPVAEQASPNAPSLDLLESEVAVRLNSNVLKPEEEGHLRTPEHARISDMEVGFTCPHCHGHLWEMEDGSILRFRCRVGHAFTADSLVRDKTEDLEQTLWAALNALEENAALQRRLAVRASANEHHLLSQKYSLRAEETRRYAESLREVLATPLFNGAVPDLGEEPLDASAAAKADTRGTD